MAERFYGSWSGNLLLFPLVKFMGDSGTQALIHNFRQKPRRSAVQRAGDLEIG